MAGKRSQRKKGIHITLNCSCGKPIAVTNDQGMFCEDMCGYINPHDEQSIGLTTPTVTALNEVMQGLLGHMSIPIVRRRIHCGDGVSLSVQAGCGMYSTPRNNEGPWSNFEVGYIRTRANCNLRPPEIWYQYALTNDTGDGAIFANVPYALVMSFIADHGGLAEHAPYNQFMGTVVTPSLAEELHTCATELPKPIRRRRITG
jgi:hypothetical protein